MPAASGVSGAAFSACAKQAVAKKAAMTAIAARLLKIDMLRLRKMGKTHWTSLSQRRLRQCSLEERKPINGGHAGIADRRQPWRRRSEQARQAIGDHLHRKHRLDTPARVTR